MIVSGLGAICKTSGKIHLIHDCSRPEGTAVNDYATADKIRYQTVTDASKLLTKNCFMAKVDLESAYRSVKIHKDDHEAAGLQFKFAGAPEPVYMVDTRLPFGATRAPGTFHRLTQAVRRMMARRGFRTTIVYLDDWLIIAETEEECRLALNTPSFTPNFRFFDQLFKSGNANTTPNVFRHHFRQQKIISSFAARESTVS